jgi:hypothetical protein
MIAVQQLVHAFILVFVLAKPESSLCAKINFDSYLFSYISFVSDRLAFVNASGSCIKQVIATKMVDIAFSIGHAPNLNLAALYKKMQIILIL